jgi:hypothetical protein
MEKVIETSTSFLAKGNILNITNADLFERIIEEIAELLDHKPEIMVYGKTCHQQRDVGFFSNESIGYQYSGKLVKSKEMTPCLMDKTIMYELFEKYFK